jgi:L-alanine-DL-glutamate epimerase-like enolase superfamily enzyme
MSNQTDNRRPEDNVNTASRPSDLRITDVRTCTVGWHGWRFPLVRIDTNQGIYGIGEVRDGATKNYALMLKRQLIGENPCNLDKVFRKIKQFGGHARQGGGVCGVEMALMDLAGKAYHAPAYMLAGGKFRDKVRMYCDTPNEPTGEAMGHKLLGRLAKGFTMLKMDVGIEMLRDEPGTLTWPAGMLGETPMNSTEFDKIVDRSQIMHPFTHIHISPKGLKMLAQYVADVRAVIGYDVPLAVDHFGHIGVDDCLKLGEALEPFNLAWLEDMVPWQHTTDWGAWSALCARRCAPARTSISRKASSRCSRRAQ